MLNGRSRLNVHLNLFNHENDFVNVFLGELDWNYKLITKKSTHYNYKPTTCQNGSDRDTKLGTGSCKTSSLQIMALGSKM